MYKIYIEMANDLTQDKARILVPYSIKDMVHYYQSGNPEGVIMFMYNIDHDTPVGCVHNELKGLEHALYLGLDESQRRIKEERLFDELASMHLPGFNFSSPLIEEYAKVIRIRDASTTLNWEYLHELLGNEWIERWEKYCSELRKDKTIRPDSINTKGIGILTDGKNPLSDVDKRPELLERITSLYNTLYDCAVFQSSDKVIDYPTPSEWQLSNLQRWRHMKFIWFCSFFTGNDTDGILELQKYRINMINKLSE